MSLIEAGSYPGGGVYTCIWSRQERYMKLYFTLNFYISIKLAYENQFINLKFKSVYSALQTYAFPKA